MIQEDGVEIAFHIRGNIASKEEEGNFCFHRQYLLFPTLRNILTVHLPLTGDVG